MPRNPHFTRSLHFKVHKVLRLPRNLHFKVHKALRLPRNLHIKIIIAHPCQRLSQQEHFQGQHQDAKTQASLETSRDFLKRATCPKVFGPPKHEVYPAHAAKKVHQVRKCARCHNESTRASTPIPASLRSRNALRRSRGE